METERPSTGSDPLDQCTDMGAPSCKTDGACNGAGACELYVAGTTCVAAACPVGGGTYTQAGTCNGTGTCQAGASSSRRHDRNQSTETPS